MDVDPPPSSGVTCQSASSHLKRSSSAPMINELVSCPVANTTNTATMSKSGIIYGRESPTSEMFSSLLQPRVRRFSASFSPGRSGGSSPGPYIPSRVSQLKQEEGMDLVGREVAHECEIQSALKMSQSWEDLSLTVDGGRRSGRNYSDPLHLSLPPASLLYASPLASPSPTRGTLGTPSSTPMSTNSAGARPPSFSPGVQVAIRSGGGIIPFSPSPSPSPTRKSFTRRSLSPITMRPSPLGGAMKRKYECDGLDFPLFGSTAPKRLNMGGTSLERPPSVGLLMAHPLEATSTTTASPAPGSLSSVGTPDSMSSADSPGSCLFQPVHSPNNGPIGAGGGAEAMLVDSTSGGGGRGSTLTPTPPLSGTPSSSSSRAAPTRMSVDVADEPTHNQS